jgi:hypothetical protein
MWRSRSLHNSGQGVEDAPMIKYHEACQLGSVVPACRVGA